VGDADRARAAAALSGAQRDGRFGSSDEYERRMEALAAARRQSDVVALTGDLDDLVPSPVRQEVLDAVARAHARGLLDFEEFEGRSDRALRPLSYADAGVLVADLGYEVVDRRNREPARWRRWVRLVGVPAAVGGVAGVALVAVPAAVDLPGDAVHWLPLAIGTGVFTAVGSAIAAVAWKVRRRGVPTPTTTSEGP